MSDSKFKKIGKYDVLDILGRGGMGVIYKAIDPAIGRLVAIKMITGAYSEDPDLLKRFYREAQSTGTLQHPNIVTVYELGDLEGTPYLVMEFLDGEGLDKVISGKRPMPLVEKLAMAVEICRGLSYAHQKTVIHRDIKPANVIILRSGGIKIVDFGIARIGNDQLTKPGQVVGSIHYMSPEQINAIPVDARTDIFSTGVLLYELISYTLPFQGRDTFNTLMKILNQEAAPLDSLVPGLPPELNNIVQQALMKDRELRYASIDDLAFDLNRLLDRLKEEIISGYLTTAEKCIKAAEWAAAKEQISFIFRIDRQHTKANMLNREITAAIQREQVQSQIREHRAVAEKAFAQNHYDEALASLDQALALRKTDPTIIRFRDSVEVARSKAVKLADLLRRADAAHDSGDLDDADAAIELALAIDSESSEAKALQGAIRREREELKKHKQFEDYLEVSRKHMAARHYTAAIEVLKKAEELDPSAARVHELISLAVLNQEQERRRKELEEVCREVEEALNRDDYNAACVKAEKALERFPGDRALLKLKTLADKQKELGERRAFVDTQIKASRRLLDQRKSPDAATLLEEALKKYPAEAALVSQLAMVQDIIAREREEERKSKVIHEAKDALLKKNYQQAIQILENARRELKSSEIDDLLQFTHDEAAAAARQQKIRQITEDAQRLLDAEEFAQAGDLLEKSLAEFPEEELRILLVETRHAAEKFDQKVKDAIGTADRMVRARRPSDGLKYLESMPASFSRVQDFQNCLARTREEHCKLESLSAAKAEARSALDNSDFDHALAVIDNSQTFCGDISELADLRREIESTRQSNANARIQKAIHEARLVLLVRSHEAALKILDEAGALLEYASADLRAQFASLKNDAQESKEKQDRDAQRRKEFVSGAEQSATRVVGSSATSNSEDTLWAGAATATPIPQELTKLEAGIIRERDLLKLHGLLAKCESASPTDCDSIELQTESLSEMYGDDAEFQSVVSQILNRLAEIEQSAHPSTPEVEERPPEPELDEPSAPVPAAELLTQPEPQVSGEKTQLVTALEEDVAAKKSEDIQAATQPDESPALIPAAPETATEPEKLPPTAPPTQSSTASASVERTEARPSSATQGPGSVSAPLTKEPPSKKGKGRKKAETSEPRAAAPEPAKKIAPPPPVLPKATQPAPTSFTKYYVSAAAIAVLIVVILLVKGQFSSSPKPKPDQGRETAATTAESSAARPPVPSTQPANPSPTPPESVPEKKAETTEPISAPTKRTAVELVGAPPATIVRVDGKVAGQVDSAGGLSIDLAPGTHNFELTRQGYQPLHLRQKIAANHVVTMGPKQLAFQPTPNAAKSSPQEQQPPVVTAKTEPTPVPAIKTPAPTPPPDPAASEWAKVANTHDANALSDFIRKYPNTAQAAEANRRLDQLRAEASRLAAEKATAELAATRSSIEQTLTRYAQAYRDRDANAITSVWPGLNKGDLKKIQESFKAAKSIQMSLRPVSEPAINGDAAQVVCSRSLQYTFPQGEQKPVQDKVTVQLRKQNGLWVIEKVQ